VTAAVPGRASLRVTRAALVWAAVAVILAVVGWYKTINLLVLGGYVLLALLSLNTAAAWLVAGRLRVGRLPIPPTFPGEFVAVAATVTNVSTRPATALLTAEAGPNRAAWLLAPLAGGDTQTISTTWAFSTRGRHVVGPVVVDSAHPLGLVHVFRPLCEPAEILVLPAVGRVDLEMFRRWLIRGGGADVPAPRSSRRSAPGGGDVRGLRPYRPGDSPREVHWRTSARRGQLLVREYDQVEPLDVTVVVDPYLPADPMSADRAALEWSLSLATTLAQAWAAADAPADLTLVVPGDGGPVVHHGRATPAFVRRAFAALAEVEGIPSVPPVPADAVRRRSRRATLILAGPRAGGPLFTGFRAGGLAVREVTPHAPVAWYTAPAGPPERTP